MCGCMYQRILLGVAVVCAIGLFSGCGKIVENISYGEFVPSPIPSVCSEDVDCRLTDELYDPCGSVHAIHVDTPQSVIDEYNQVQMNLNEGAEYDCDVPPSVDDYIKMCRDHVCVSAQIQ